MTQLPRISRIWGPTKTIHCPDRILWNFQGVRENGEFCRWQLSFTFDTRSFRTRRFRGGSEGAAQAKVDQLPHLTAGPVQEGRITPMLRAMLKPDHIAEAARLALERNP